MTRMAEDRRRFNTAEPDLDNPLLAAALDYADRDIPVFPCKREDKSPFTRHGFKDATTIPKKIRNWWREWPQAMIGVPTGRKSRIDVLDIDLKPEEYVDGFKHVPNWKTLSPVIVRTPSGGAHCYFKSDDKLHNSTDQIGPGVDTRGEGGYVIVPPSYNRDGDYLFIKGDLEDFDDLPLFPADLFAKLGPRLKGQTNPDRQADPQRVRAAMNVIPNPDLGWEDWNKFGMAIWAATSGSNEGFTIFDEWSQGSSRKYKAGATRKKWEALTRSPPTRIGAGTIFHHASQIAPDWAAGGAPILSAQTPLESARVFVKRQFSSEGSVSLVHYRGDFYEWLGTHYQECEKDDLRSLLYEFLDKAVTPTKIGFAPFNPTSSKVNQILDALAAGVQETSKPNAPFWIGNPQDADNPAKLIACRNGLLNIETRRLVPHTPHFFNVNCLPFDYDPRVPVYPPKWMKFLHQLWPGDDGQLARDALQEMFGLMLTSDTSYQKIFGLFGPKRSGKGTIARILRTMLGKDNVAGPTLASISTQFGLQPCINKQTAIISDARLGKGSNVPTIAERLLSISGEDALTIDRKYKDAWTGQLGIRFLILSNELPQIPDAAGALASRFVILMLTRTFYGQEDRMLTEKLSTELPGILNWSLAGLKRLRRYGCFEMPQASLAAIRQLEDLASPVRAFLRDWCDTTDVNASANVGEFYKAYRLWCEERGIRLGNAIVFGRNLRALLPQLQVSGRGKRRYYAGIKLNAEGRTACDDAADTRRSGSGNMEDDES